MGPEKSKYDTVRRQAKRLFVWVLGFLLIGTTVAIVYFSMPYHGDPESITAVEENPAVTVTETDNGYILEPADRTPESGVIFYPGGRVHPDAYVGSLAPISRDANMTVVIPEMPLNLAVIDYGLGQSGLRSHAADRAMAEYPTVEEWYVGGHSLGGAMACRYADSNEAVDGLLLYASYCDVNISESGLEVLSIAGEADNVINWKAYENGVANLPDTADVVILEGVNHTQFGSYTGQDNPTGTSFEEAHKRLNEVVVPWFAENSTRVAVNTVSQNDVP